MKKLRLRLDELSVDSFAVTPSSQERGTVRGEQGTHITYCTCNEPTCAFTCWNTCPETCDDATCVLSCAESCGGTCFQSRCVDSCICN